MFSKFSLYLNICPDCLLLFLICPIPHLQLLTVYHILFHLWNFSQKLSLPGMPPGLLFIWQIPTNLSKYTFTIIHHTIIFNEISIKKSESIKTTRCYYKSVWMAKIWSTKTANVGTDVKNGCGTFIVGGNGKRYNHWKIASVSYKQSIPLPYNWTIMLLVIYPKEWKSYIRIKPTHGYLSHLHA